MCRRGSTVRGVRARRPNASRTQKSVLLLLHAGVVFLALRFRNSSLASGKIMLAPTGHGSMAATWSRQQKPSLSFWCPGDVIPTHTFVNADHNGVYRWESQLAAPGRELEQKFVNFTSWKSVNQNPDADFYASDASDGTTCTKLVPRKCYKPGKCAQWTAKC